jgi:hypothetical protein
MAPRSSWRTPVSHSTPERAKTKPIARRRLGFSTRNRTLSTAVNTGMVTLKSAADNGVVERSPMRNKV